jgi:hypothetical protein
LTWEFLVHCPRVRTRALLTLGPLEDAEDIDHAPLQLTQRLNPQGRLESRGGPYLPETFRDSPAVVAELAERGVDFVTGSTDLKLESRCLPSGEVVWVVEYGDGEHAVRLNLD